MGGEKAYYPRFGLLQIKKVQGSSFSRQNLVNHNNDPQIQRVLEIYKKKGRIEERKRRKNARTRRNMEGRLYIGIISKSISRQVN